MYNNPSNDYTVVRQMQSDRTQTGQLREHLHRPNASMGMAWPRVLNSALFSLGIRPNVVTTKRGR